MASDPLLSLNDLLQKAVLRVIDRKSKETIFDRDIEELVFSLQYEYSLYFSADVEGILNGYDVYLRTLQEAQKMLSSLTRAVEKLNNKVEKELRDE